MKLFERHDLDTTREQLPELPPGVEVPDDLSGIVPPTSQHLRTGGVRWMRWLAIFALLACAGVLIARSVDRSGSDTPADDLPTNLMQYYGTDNPTFVEGAPGPHSVQIIGNPDLMVLYGTDNPVFVDDVTDTVDTGEFFRRYGTDNPTFLPEPSLMDRYGTDNPTFVDND